LIPQYISVDVRDVSRRFVFFSPLVLKHPVKEIVIPIEIMALSIRMRLPLQFLKSNEKNKCK